MTNSLGFPKGKPNFNYVLNEAQEATMSKINCHNIGKILKFDKDTQTCTVQPMQLKTFRGTTYSPAPITDVPLIFYGLNGDCHITLPNPEGSICLLFFMDRNIDNFLETGEMYEPDNTRLHDFSDCIAITTFSTLNNPIENYDDTSISIFYSKLVEEVLYKAVIKNYANSIQLRVWASGVNSQINISNKINIQNNSRNLATLIDELITTIKGLQINTNNGKVTQGSQDALDAIADKFKELLE